jgi:hypothetical protein
LATPEVVERLIAGLADDVPASDLDRRDGGHVDLRPFGGESADQALRNHFDLKGIHAEHKVFELVNGCFHSFGEIVERSFADAGQTFIGENFCK